MDNRYLVYATTKGKFYNPPGDKTKKTAYKRPKLRKGWSTEIDEYCHWRYYICHKNELPEQGWKIHVTAPLYAAQHILDICAPILMDNDMDFKYVDNEWELFMKNSKYGDRGATGKFITVYPKNIEEFEQMIYVLDEALKGTPRGPYVLSDKCWKDSNVFFRYGGIKAMYMNKGDGRVLAIKNINGEYIEDERTPYYNVPDFVEEPDFIKKMDMEQNKEGEPSNLEQYEITNAIHFSNGGGVYCANRKRDGKKVVLKEGRPEAGIDGDKKDANSRVYHEARILDKLSDLEGVVHYYGIFKEWKHIFLEEEFIDTISLNRYITRHYPFFDGIGDIQAYTKGAAQIVRNIVKTVEEIHNRNIGVGDLQPMNIMVNPDDFSIKMIDMEAAGDLKTNEKPALFTPGFASMRTRNKLEGDWFAVLRIARYIFLPIGSVQDIDERLLERHDNWIEANFGIEAIEIIREVEAIADKHLKFHRAYKSEYFASFMKNKTLDVVVDRMRKGIVEYLKEEDILIGGDIRQFEDDGGKLNVKTGGFGVVMALNRTGELPETARNWAKTYSTDEKLRLVDNGLFSGKAGIASVLYEIGMHDRAREIFESIDIDKNSRNIAILSGLAGIGLALQGYVQVEKSDKSEKNIELIAAILEERLNEEFKVAVVDPDALSIGLFNGWAGVALFFIKQYEKYGDKKWLNLAVQSLKKDLKNCVYDDNGVYYVDDDKRFFPYLADGSLGIGIVISELRRYMGKSYLADELAGTELQLRTRCCYNAGLFYGYAGYITFGNCVSVNEGKEFDRLDLLMESLGVYLIEDNGKIYCPGNYSYRISGDIFSGAAGTMVTLFDVINRKKFSWLPVINID